MRLILLAATAAAALSHGAAQAQSVTFEGEAAVVSDYRFRGFSLSDEQPALQAGVTARHEASGFYAGVWGSTIDEYGVDANGEGATVEVDFTVGRAFTAGGFDWDVALAAYTYPGGENVSYLEIPVSVSRTIGDVTGTLGGAYVPEQDNTGNQSNTYVYTAFEVAPESWPVAVDAHLGWEDGAFGDEKLDWSIGVTKAFGPVFVGLRYVDADDPAIDSTVVGSLGVSF